MTGRPEPACLSLPLLACPCRCLFLPLPLLRASWSKFGMGRGHGSHVAIQLLSCFAISTLSEAGCQGCDLGMHLCRHCLRGWTRRDRDDRTERSARSRGARLLRSRGLRGDPDDGIDDRVPAQCAIDDAAINGGEVCFGPGTWDLTRAPVGSYDRFAALSWHAPYVTIRGAGMYATTLRVAGDQGTATTKSCRSIPARTARGSATSRSTRR